MAGVASCKAEVRNPAIGFTYNWGAPELERYLQQMLDEARAPGTDSVRLVGNSSGSFAGLSRASLAAEVVRARRLVEDSTVLAVIGPGGSREALQVSPVYTAAKMAVIVPTATSRLLANVSPYVFLLAPNDSVQGAFITTFADSVLGAKTIAVYHVPDEYGIGLASGVTASASLRGVRIVERTAIRLVRHCANAEGQQYYQTIVAALAVRGKPDAVVLAARTQEATCLGLALRQRWPGLPLIAGDGVYLDASFFRVMGDAGEGMHLVAFWHRNTPGVRSRQFADAFTRETGLEPRHGDAVFADATMLVAAAIRSGARTRAGVVEYLRSLGTTRPAYEGVSGPISFAPGARRPLWMTRVEGRSSVLVGGI